MKKFIAVVLCIALLAVAVDSAYFRWGMYVDFAPGRPVETFVKTEGKTILLDRGNGYEEFEIRGVNLGSGKPGEWATDFAIDKETYLRWFRYIREMGANTIRVYTIQQDVFYNALYEYNHIQPGSAVCTAGGLGERLCAKLPPGCLFPRFLRYLS